MSEHTYAGHTLAEIKAAAEAAISQSDAIGEPEWYDAGVFSQIDPIGHDATHIATANPTTVLAMAARIEELERELAEARHANTHAGLRAMYQRAMHDLGTARLEGWQAAREQAAKVCHVQADKALSLQSGGPTELTNVFLRHHAAAANECTAAIRAMQPPAEWQCSEVAPVCGAAPNDQRPVIRGEASGTIFDWPHPDGFAGGLTEKQERATTTTKHGAD